MIIPFEKYHALENDFLVIEQKRKRYTASQLRTIARRLCHRKIGIGADGLLVLTAERSVERHFAIFNADGSKADISGNGLRIAGAYLFRRDKRKRRFIFSSAQGEKTVEILSASKNEYKIKTNLGEPEFQSAKIPVRSTRKYFINSPITLGDTKIPITCLSVGNPHAVLFVADFDFDWRALGNEIEHHRMFPQRTNVEFVKVLNRKRLKIAEWERGVGATGSSGTGAAAAVCAAVMLGLTGRQVTVEFEGGNLHVEWLEADNSISLSGAVAFICRGESELF